MSGQIDLWEKPDRSSTRHCPTKQRSTVPVPQSGQSSLTILPFIDSVHINSLRINVNKSIFKRVVKDPD